MEVQRSLTNEVINQIRKFRQTNEYSHIYSATNYALSLSKIHKPVLFPILFVRGWYVKKGFKRITTKRTLSLGNFGKVRFRRYFRKDVAIFPINLIRFGFTISWKSKSSGGDLSKFLLPKCCETNRWLHFSSNQVRESFKLAFNVPENQLLEWGNDQHCECGAIGYIDEMWTQSEEPNESSYFFFDLVHGYPAEFYTLLKQTKSTELINSSADLWAQNPFPAYWHDLFQLLSKGQNFKPLSNLNLYKIIRPFALAPSTSRLLSPRVNKMNNIVDFRISGKNTFLRPSDQIKVLDNVEVQLGGLILEKNNLVNIEWAADPIRDFVSANWKYVFSSRNLPDDALVELFPYTTEQLEEGILLSGRNDANWYHWICEYMPRALSFAHVDPEVPFIISDKVPEQGIEALQAISKREIKTVPYFSRTKIAKLHVTPPVVQILDEFGVPPQESVVFNEEALKNLIERIKPEDATGSRRVFCYRKSTHRNLLNEDECAAVASELGFEVIDINGLTWREQVALYSSVKLLVSAGGAIMANYLLMPENSMAIALVSEPLKDFMLPAVLARISNIEFRYLYGQPSKPLDNFDSYSNFIHQDFTIDIQNLRKMLLVALENLT